MSDFIRVPRAFKKRSKRSVLTVDTGGGSGGSGGAITAAAAASASGEIMGRADSSTSSSSIRKDKRSFKRGSIKERWLLTRKTWKYMTDFAGRRGGGGLLPEGVGNKAEDIPKIEQYFQEVCRNEPRFLVWRRKCSYPGAAGPMPQRRRRWKNRFGTVSPKKAGSADEAEDEYNETLEQVQYEQLMIDMLRNYLDIKEEEEDEGKEGDGDEGKVNRQHQRGNLDQAFPSGSLGITTTTSMLSLNTPTTTTTSAIRGGERFDGLTGGASGGGGGGGYRTLPGRTKVTGSNAFMTSSDVAKGLSHYSPSSTKTQTTSTSTTPSPFSLFTSSRDMSAVHLMANMKRFQRGPSVIDKITPAVLNDKVALRKIYDQLRASNRLHRLMAANSSALRASNQSKSNTRLGSMGSPQYQRSALGVHTTFAYPELSGKSRSFMRSLNKVSDGSSSSLFTRHYDTSTSNTPSSSLYGIDEGSVASGAAPKRPERRIHYHTEGIQTDPIPMPTLNELSAEYKKQLEAEEAMMREEEMAQLEAADPVASRNERRNSEDVSQSVSDTIKRYLRMARKKPPKDDVNRFKRINYDRNLRNIKAKGETTKIGDDDGNCKGCQTEEDWIVKSFAHLSKDAPATVPAVRPTTLPGTTATISNKPAGASSGTTPVSSPSSPGILSSSSNIFHTSTQFLSNLFGHTTPPATVSLDGSSNDSFYGSSAAMQKSKSSSNIVSRKIWKSRSKSQSRPVVPVKAQWTPQGNCIWTSSQGHTIKLPSESALYELTEVERKILYRLALGKINQFNLGINTESLSESITSRASGQKPVKRKALLLKRKALTTGFFDSGKDDSKGVTRGRVFGIPLEQSMENEMKERQEARSSSTKSERRARNSLSSLMDPNAPPYRCSGSCESLPSKTQQADSELLKGSLSQFDIRRSSNSHDDEDELPEGLERRDRPLVPAVIITCVQHLERHLNTVGLFRKSTSKKRVRQLREEFDQSSGGLELDEETCPHDVATLLKEYLRDLPEPLLCRRLYQPFVNTQKIRNRRLQFEAISYLVQLLPVSHRDTLYFILKFLAKVARYANDVQSANGDVISEGNKMDSNNLATVFAPNILHDAVIGQVTSEQEVCERLDVINVIRIMIDHYEEMYRISAETLDEVYLNMIDSHPQQLDILCDRVDYKSQDSDASSQLSPTSPPATTAAPQTTAQLLEANKQKRLYAREEFLHQNASKDERGHGKSRAAVEATTRRRFNNREVGAGGGGQQDGLGSAQVDDIFSRRRMSSPFSFTNNVLTASLRIPVQMSSATTTADDIPFIEDDRYNAAESYSPSSSSGPGSRRGTSGNLPQTPDSRKSSGTVTGTLSLSLGPSLTLSPTTSNSSSSSMFFGEDFGASSVFSPGTKGKTISKGPPPPVESFSTGVPTAATAIKSSFTSDNELRKSSSLFTVGGGGGGANKKSDTKAPPAKQKLSIYPSTTQEQKITAISSIGGDLLRSKTADFERFLGHIDIEAKKPAKGPIYKRKELISSAHNSSK